MLAASASATALVPWISARPLLLAGGAASAGGLYWLSRMTEHGTHAGGLIGPILVTGAGVGLLIVPLPLVADSARAQAAAAARAASPVAAATWQAAYQHALAAGFDRAFLVAAAIAVLILVVAITSIRLRRADLADS